MATPIGVLTTIPTITVGGRVFTDITTLIIVHGYTSSNTRTSCRQEGGSAGYQVTAGKTYTVQAATLQSSQAASATAASTLAVPAYADNDVNSDSSTAFTNGVYASGSASVYTLAVSSATNSTLQQYGHLKFAVAAQKYVSAQFNAIPGIIWMFGYEA